jgi:hypothetical protein
MPPRARSSPVGRAALGETTMTPYRSEIEALVMRIQTDFLETPELHLTLEQARHRFGLDRTTCKAVMEALVDVQVLAKTQSQVFVRFVPARRPMLAA